MTLAYELYYAFATTSTRLEIICFLVWFQLDLAFVALALWRVYGPDQRKRIAGEMLVYCITALAGLRYLGYLYPDDREQVTAYWTGILLQLPAGWVYVYGLVKHRSLLGHSLEIWYATCFSCSPFLVSFINYYRQARALFRLLHGLWSFHMAVSQHPSKLGVCGIVLEHRGYCDYPYSGDCISFPVYLGIQSEQKQGKNGLNGALRAILHRVVHGH